MEKDPTEWPFATSNLGALATIRVTPLLKLSYLQIQACGASPPFFDVRGHLFDNGKWAANAGAGIRTLWGQRAYGINTYYDHRSSGHLDANQIGVGLETLGQLYDFRINGYFPFGKKVSDPYNTGFAEFSGHTMLISQKYKFALTGVNAEFGFHFGKTENLDFYGAAGPYYFRGHFESNTWGGKARISGVYKEYVSLELSNSYDNTFHNRFQGQIALSLPLGPKSRVERKGCINTCDFASVMTDRMLQPVFREEIVVQNKKKKKSPAIDPATGLPYFFVFVNNTSSSNGSYESPYHSFAQVDLNSGPNDIIYVFPGDGTTSGMDMGINLKANQRFWGSGVSQSIQTTAGEIVIPPQSSSSPIITGTGDAVTLATNNEVSGFTIASAASHGIFGIDPQNLKISSCTIQNSGDDQIHLEYAASAGTITMNTLTLQNGLSHQVFIDSTTTGSMALNLDQCVIEGGVSNSFYASFTNEASVQLTSNQFLSVQDSAFFNLNGTSTFVMSDTIMHGQISNTSPPVVITATGGDLTIDFSRNTLSDNTTGGLAMNLLNVSNAQLSFTDNSFTHNGSGIIGTAGSTIFINPNGTTISSCAITLNGNTFTDNAPNSFYVNYDGTITNLHVAASKNTMTNNGGAGLAFAPGSNTFTLIATENTMTGLSDHGIATLGVNPANISNLTITGNTISDLLNFADGIALSQETTTLNMTISGNKISNCNGSGIVSYANSAMSTATFVNIANNTISNCQNMGSNTASGLALEQYLTLSGSITNNTFSGNIAPFPVAIDTTLPNPTVCIELAGNSNDIGYLLANTTGGTFNLSPLNATTGANTGTFTIMGPITTVSSCPP